MFLLFLITLAYCCTYSTVVRISVALVNQNFPDRVLTFNNNSTGRLNERQLSLENPSEENMENQIFAVLPSIHGGIVLFLGGRHSAVQDLDIFMEDDNQWLNKREIYVKISGNRYRDTFRLVSRGMCLGAEMDWHNGSVFPRFQECVDEPNQLWGMFSASSIRRLLKIPGFSTVCDDIRVSQGIRYLNNEFYKRLYKKKEIPYKLI